MVRRLVNWLIYLPLGVIVVVLAVANRQSVTLSIDPFEGDDSLLTIQLPLFLVAFAALLIGLMLGGTVVWFGQRKHRTAARRAQSELVEALGEVDRLKADLSVPRFRSLRPQPLPVRRWNASDPMTGLIKICGLSSPDTLDVALDCGAEMIGLVFYPRSPRCVSLTAAKALAAQARGKAQIVALTVDMDDNALDDLIDTVRPDLLQLHGKESGERIAHIKRFFRLPVMKACGIASAADVQGLSAFYDSADRLLLDAKPPADPAALPGGNGLTFDWRLIKNIDLPLPFMLSGGLTPDNVAEAIALTGVKGVDVSSGVESAPGVKDPERIAAFIAHARTAFAEGRQP